MKREKGITLIALVITVIVLLILAGVSIAMVVGNNGILSQASRSVIATKEASAKEEVALAWSSVDSEYWGAWSSNTSKQRTEYFTEANLNKYLEGKGTVSNLVYNPGGVSTLTYTSKADNVAYELQIDSSGKVSVVGEATVVPPTPEDPEDPTPSVGTLVSGVTSVNYGDKVSYTANGVSDWRIFYNDGSNVFIIASDCLENTKLPAETDMETYAGYAYSAYWPTESNLTRAGASAIDTSVASKYKLGWLSGNSGSTNNNAKAVATLLDTSAWSCFVDSNLGESAIGCPTLEMYTESWNAKGYTTLYTNTNSTGYYLGTTPTPTSYYVDMSTDAVGYGDTLYYPHTEAYNNCYGYWLASPSADSASNVVAVGYGGDVSYGSYYNCSLGVRPVVCLQSSVNGTKSGDTWILSK